MDINKQLTAYLWGKRIDISNTNNSASDLAEIIMPFISSKLKEVLDECIGDKLPEDIDNYAYENYVGVGYIKHRQHCIEIKNKLNI